MAACFGVSTQVLNRVKAEGDMIRLAKNMTQLRNFGITDVREEDEMDLCSSIQKMMLLCHLLVKAPTDNGGVLRMDALSSPPPHLRKLTLIGKLEKVPRWFHSLHNLTHLFLHRSRLREDPLPSIQSLLNLVSLVLVGNAYEGKELVFRTGFQKLERLEIRASHMLNEIIIEKGVMPGLQTLILFLCKELKTLPRGIKHLTNLQEMHVGSASKELIERIRGEESGDSPMIRRIPSIKQYYLTPSGKLLIESLS